MLYNVHEKSLIERECELNYQKNSEQKGKKYLVFGIYNLTISTQKVDLLMPQKQCKAYLFEGQVIIIY